MSQCQMTRWIEIADERHFWEDTTLDRTSRAHESQFLHLGETILKVTAKASSYALACGRRATRLTENRANVARCPQDHFGGEPTLSDLLHDPMAQALMAADRVDRRQLDILLDATRRNLAVIGR